jgi:hypothetical protein
MALVMHVTGTGIEIQVSEMLNGKRIVQNYRNYGNKIPITK